MAEGRSPKKASEVLQAVHEFVLGPEEDIIAIPSDVHAALKAEGLDPSALSKHVPGAAGYNKGSRGARPGP